MVALASSLALVVALAIAPVIASGPSWSSENHLLAVRGASNLQRRDTTEKKYVFAHVVQGDFLNYSNASWAADIALAKAAGIDAFALDVGHNPTDPAELALAFAAADADGTFKLFFSFDGNYFNTAAAASDILTEYLTPFASKSSYFTYDSKVFVSTFAGDSTATYLGNTTSLQATADAWTTLIASAAAQSPAINVSRSPWRIETRKKTETGVFKDLLLSHDVNYAPLSGIMSWSSAWPAAGEEITAANDTAYITAAKGKNLTYIAPVSAFFYVHNSETNNYIYRSDDWLLPNHYSQLINLTVQPDFIELLTWNDYGESHYLGPIRSDANPPALSGNYSSSDFDHTPMLTMSSYYNSWYKTGNVPTIGTETIVWWYRPHPKDATASADSLSKPSNTDFTDDNIYAAIFLPHKSKATQVVITTGGSATASQSVSAGVNLIKVAFVTGATGIDLQDKSGKSILSGSGTAIDANPTTYNFNYHSYILPANSTPSTLVGSTSTKSAASTMSMSYLGAAIVVAATFSSLV